MGFFDFLFGNNSNKNSSDNNQESSKTSPSTAGSKTSIKESSPTSHVSEKPNKAIDSYNIDEIYGKGFRFVVDRYEEWENQKCVNQGKLKGEIVAEVVGDRIVFTLSGFDGLNIVQIPSMDLSHPHSRVLKSKGSLIVTSDRIQYVANNITDIHTDPYVCNLFYDNGRISYVRFGFMDPNSSAILPLPIRIYEFFGDMVELDCAKERKATKTEFKPFVFRSTCHQRYENIMPIGALQKCLRTVSVEKNVSGCSGYLIQPGDGYIVKLFNNDIGQPNMADKPMRVKSISKDLVILQGYPLKARTPFGWMDVNYDEYGLEVHYKNGEIEKCILHMYERDTFIEYRR